MDGNGPRLPFHFNPLARQFIELFAAYTDGRIHGGNLHALPDKGLEGFLQSCKVKVPHRTLCKDLSFQVSRIGAKAKGQLRPIGLAVMGRIFQKARCLPGKDWQNTGSHGIKGPRMTDFLHLENLPHGTDNVVTGHPRWFQHIEDAVHPRLPSRPLKGPQSMLFLLQEEVL